MCLCASLEPIPNTVGIHVVQHPRERRHALGTVRLLRLGLAKFRVDVLRLSGNGAAAPPIAFGAGTGLLYPSEDSLDLATLAPEEHPSHLVVIDGTWSQANKMYRDNAWLSSLPSYRLSPEPSRYRIREQPRVECVSTLESVVAALRCLQPDLAGLDTLGRAFDAMIDAQITASKGPSTRPKAVRVRKKVPRPVPEALLSNETQTILVYTEAEPVRSGRPTSRGPARLSAVTLDGDRVFDRIVQTHYVPTAVEALHMGLRAEDFERAQPLDVVMTDFRAFCSPDSDPKHAVLATWGPRTRRWLGEYLPDVACILLKGVWANLARGGAMDLETVVSELGLTVPDAAMDGRSGRHLSCARAVAHHFLASQSQHGGDPQNQL